MTLSRKLQAWDVTTFHDSLLVRKFYVQAILRGYFRSLEFVGPATQAPLSLSGLVRGPFFTHTSLAWAGPSQVGTDRHSPRPWTGPLHISGSRSLCSAIFSSSLPHTWPLGTPTCVSSTETTGIPLGPLSELQPGNCPQSVP